MKDKRLSLFKLHLIIEEMHFLKIHLSFYIVIASSRSLRIKVEGSSKFCNLEKLCLLTNIRLKFDMLLIYSWTSIVWRLEVFNEYLQVDWFNSNLSYIIKA